MTTSKKLYRNSTLLKLAIAVLVTPLIAAPDFDYKIHRELMSHLSDSEGVTAPMFVVFAERPQLAAALHMRDWNARGRFAVQSLKSVADRSQLAVRMYLRARSVEHETFWIENKIFIRAASLELARTLTRHPEVIAVLPERTFAIPSVTLSNTGSSLQAVEWNLAQIRADQAWSTTTGMGVIVANIDSGVDYLHSALSQTYLGSKAGGPVHVGAWKDTAGGCAATPCDGNGHGTHTMGVMVGSDKISNNIGVAPGAKWIACRACAGSSCAEVALIACAQWIMDPYENGSGTGRPHVVNNSWAGTGGNPWYESYVTSWRAAGIFSTFAAGNTGSACGTAASPGDYAGSFASGASDRFDAIALFSARGPSAFGAVKPDVTAPGVEIRSAIPGNAYGVWSGTSMASPHVGGVTALMFGAAPALIGNVSAVETALKETAVRLATPETCGGIPFGVVPNNTYGSGRIDALAAVQRALVITNQPPAVTITTPLHGTGYNCPAIVTFGGQAIDPEDGNLTSRLTWASDGTVFGSGSAASKSYSCYDVGVRNVKASAPDAVGITGSDTVTITIINSTVPSAPSALTATTGTGVVNLRWQDNSNNEDGFRVERKPGTGAWTLVVSLSRDVRTHADSASKGPWSYRIRAFNANGTSDSSNVVAIRVK